MVGLGVGLAYTLAYGPMIGLVVGLLIWLAIGRTVERWIFDEPAYANLRLKHRTKLLALALLTNLGTGLITGLAVGLIFGLRAEFGDGLVIRPGGGLTGNLITGSVVGLCTGLAAGLILSLIFAIIHRLRVGLLPLWPGIRLILALGSVSGLVLGLASGVTVKIIEPRIGLMDWLLNGLEVGGMIGLIIGFVQWVGTPNRTDWATTPRSTYEATRRLTLVQGCAAWLTVGLIGWLVSWLSRLEFSPQSWLLDGLLFALLLQSSGAWLCYILASCRLAASRTLPFQVMDLLDDAYRLGLLRATGPAYQFRHNEFQDHLIQTGKSATNDHL